MDSISNQNAKLKKTIHLIRHGQTDYNLKGIIQGSGIDSTLNQNGILQAEKFFESYKSEPYKRVYTSKLKRAIQSVEPFIKMGIPHTPLEELNEINWGAMEGAVSSPENAALYAEVIQKWSSGNLEITVEGGETPLQMFERQSRGLQEIMQNQEEDKILICMHGRAIRSFLCLLTQTHLHEMEKWAHTNLCLYELSYNGNHFDVIRENDIAHFGDM